MLYRLYNKFCKQRYPNSGIGIQIIYYLFTKFIVNYYNVIVRFKYLRTSKYCFCDNSGKDNVVLSLTTFPERIDTVWIVIECLLRQSLKPGRIILWLSKEQFVDEKKIPQKLLKQKERGLEIRFCDGDIKSHKKYYYTFKEFENEIIILVDDDIFYPLDMVENLYKSHLQNPNAIICRYAHLVTNTNKIMNSYLDWSDVNIIGKPQSDIFFGSGGGTLFPANSLDSDILNIDLALQLTPTADDIWLNAMARLHGTLIVLEDRYQFIPIKIRQNKNLWGININNNDIQINNLREHYKTKNINIDQLFIS